MSIPVVVATSERPWMRIVRLTAKRKCLWLQHLWASAETGVDSPHREAAVLVVDPVQMNALEAAFYESDAEAETIAEEIVAAEAELNGDRAWSMLTAQFALSRPEAQMLALCAAAEVNPDLKRVFGYVLDQPMPAEPTVWLAAKLFDWPSSIRMHPEGALYRWRLAYPAEGQWSQTVPWVADPTVIEYLHEKVKIDPAVFHALSVQQAGPWPCLYEDVLADILQFLSEVQGSGAVRYELELFAPLGSGRRTVAAQVAAAMDRELIAVDCRSLAAPEDSRAVIEDRIARAARTSALFRGLTYWNGADLLPSAAWNALRGVSGVHFFGTEEGSLPHAQVGVIRRRFSLPQLSRAQRSELWSLLTGDEAPMPVQEWALKPAEIVSAAQVSSAGHAAVADVCRQRVHQEPGELFSILPCPYTWDDLILAPGIEAHLREFEAQAQMRGAVYDEWGYGKNCPLGQGISALFAGPSGTGKTMAAQVMARSLGLQLFKVDLAGLLNKYVGETEKRIRAVFERCQRSNVMLFFDEADALFGHRVQTRDAHDRFANIEIDYLLQQMEQYDGLAVLATNRKAELDTAFLRRLRFIVDFLPPTPTERLRLWKVSLIAHSPSGEELLDAIDWDYLATKLTLTGAEIKNSSINAAFLARGEGTRIGMRHVMASVRRELTKQGVVVRLPEWEVGQ